MWNKGGTSRKWVGFIFRSQIIFPVEQIDMTGQRRSRRPGSTSRRRTERDGRIGESCGVEPYPMPTARGWKVYALTGPWDGNCIDTPGYQVGEIPSHANEHSVYLTDLAKGWLDGTKPNHGLIIGSRLGHVPRLDVLPGRFLVQGHAEPEVPAGEV